MRGARLGMDSMLLTKVPTQAVPQFSPDWLGKKRAALGFDGSRETRPLFDGIECWPCLDHIFRRLAVDMIKRAGVGVWLAQGGARAADGTPSFSGWSCTASEILSRIAAKTGGLHFVDEQGEQWAVLFDPNDPNRPASWRGLAIGGEFSPRLLSRDVREDALCMAAPN